MKIAVKITFAFLIVALLVLFVGYFSARKAQQIVQKSLEQNVLLLAQETMLEMDRDVYSRIETLRICVALLDAEDFLRQSNNFFMNLENRDEFIQEKDKAWRVRDSMAKDPFEKQIQENSLSQQLIKWLQSYEKRSGYRVYSEILVTNTYGVNVAQTNKISDYYQADEEWWQQTKDKGFYISDVRYDERAKGYFIDICFKLEDISGDFQGILKASYNYKQQIERIKKLKENSPFNSLQVQLLNKEEKVIYDTNNTPFLTQARPFYQGQCYLGGKGIIISKSEGEAEKLIAHIRSRGYGYFKGLGWILVLEYETKELFVGIEHLRVTLLILSFIAAVLAIFLGVVVAKSISVPILRLKKAAAEIERGNLNAQLRIESRDEIGELGDGFIRMTKKLKATTISKDYVDNIVANITDILIVVTPKGSIVTINNKATLKHLGYSDEDLKGKSFNVLFVPEETEKAQLILDKVIQEGKIVNLEAQFLAKTGSKVPVLIRGSVIRRKEYAQESSVTEKESSKKDSKHGSQIQGIVFTVEDITDRVKAQEALIQSEKRFMDVLHSSSDAILLIDHEAFIEANEATAAMLGYANREEFLMTHPSELSPPVQPDGQKSFDKANAMMRLAVEQGFHRFEWIHRKKTGEDFPVEVSLTPIMYQGRSVIHCLWRDLTEKKSKEEALKTANENLLKDEKALRNILYDLNQAHEELKKKEASLKKALNTLQETNMRLQETQAQLVQTEKLASLGQLSAGIAHEINNPLGFIANNFDILSQYIESYRSLLKEMQKLKDAVVNKDIEKSLSIVEEIDCLEENVNFDFISKDIQSLIKETRKGADRIKKIVLDLKMFSRKDEGQMELHNIEEIFEGVINIIWNEIKYKAELKKDYGGVPLVRCNAQKLGQVFINLLMNASQAIEGKGEIFIKTFEKNKKVYIEISDTGSGINKEDIKKIFDPFFTTKEVGQGTGLGLSIGYEIIKKHNGDIRVESEVGKGTKFIIELPL